ncbi:hypothetical protein BC828DRAFT_392873 [Blastocladiella britannica]|nr:hypothetical protein BC828DRAFT_392873 [Blastocladiella britannica]
MPGTSDFDDFETFSPVMTRDEIIEWFSRRLGHPPDPHDFLKVGTQFYQLGAYSRALVCLQQYVNLPAAQSMGRHLLAYCYLSLGELENALNEFKSCVRENVHEDWQLVVELAIEIEEARRNHPATPLVGLNGGGGGGTLGGGGEFPLYGAATGPDVNNGQQSQQQGGSSPGGMARITAPVEFD